MGDTRAGSSYTLPCPLPHSNRPPFKSRPASVRLFLSRAAVRRHIAHAKACRSHGAGLGHREVPIQVRAVDVMAGGGVGAGWAPTKWLCTQTIHKTDTLNLLSVHLQCSGKVYEKYAEDHGFESCLQLFLIQKFLVCTSTNQYKPVYTGMYWYVQV